MSNDSASTLFTNSAFAHGYIHGYEEGFHYGDLDLQLGRDPRDPASIDGYKHPESIDDHSGAKNSYKSGYQDGFRAGYSDAMHESPFRAIVSLRRAADGLVSIPKPEARLFDSGFREGYDHGKHQGAEDGRAHAAADPINPPCLGLPDEYCSGFARGFQVGYGDGYNNQASPRAARRLQVSAAK